MNFDSFLEKVREHHSLQLPFVIYRHPGEKLVKGQLQPNNIIEYINDFQEKGFVFAPFNSQKRAIVFSFASAEAISVEQESFQVNLKKRKYKEEQQEQDRYEKLINRTIDTIKASGLEKVVISRKKEIELETEPFLYFKRLLELYPDAMVYCWYHPFVGMWIGATPETLVKTEGRRLKTMALAGTQVFNNTKEVSWKEKEKEEQAIVTRAIVDGLSQITEVTNLQIGEPQTVKAGNVLHLKTNVSATYEADGLEKIIKKLHPTPAVCGLPFEMAYDYILNEENYDRSYYTGYLGELNFQHTKNRNPRRRNVENSAYQSVSKQTNLYVNLRCMQVFDNRLELYVGGGITKDSQPTSEWEETQRKAETMQQVL